MEIFVTTATGETVTLTISLEGVVEEGKQEKEAATKDIPKMPLISVLTSWRINF